MDSARSLARQPSPENAKPVTGAPAEKETDEWPLSYRMIPQGTGRKPWWSHTLYEDPDRKKVKVLLAKTLEESEALAQQFLDQPVVGFDMEWPCDDYKRHRLQDKIGLIQVACEDRIALFHIGLHVGTRSTQLIAPSLRRLIESPDIAKTGVAIYTADFLRLKKFFGLNPQGAFELSHLHRLVRFSAKPDLLTTKLYKLASQVEEHLGLPLSKGSVRTSNWSKPLSQKQIDYAAADAYAGYMLFHAMNIRRMALDPIPPLPVFAEWYSNGRIRGGQISALRLHPLIEGGELVLAKDFFKPKEEDNQDNNTAIESVPTHDDNGSIQNPAKKTPTKKGKDAASALDARSKLLFERLRERRSIIAKQEEKAAYMVANNATLESLALRCPLEYDELLEVKGIGENKQRQYGAEWLEVIAQHLSSVGPPVNAPERTTPPPAILSSNTQYQLFELTDSDSESAFDTPKRRKPQMNTGLSFNFAEVEIGETTVKDRPTLPATEVLQIDQINFQSASSERRSKVRGTQSDRPKVSTVTFEPQSSPSVYFTPPSRAGSKRPASPDGSQNLPSIIEKRPDFSLPDKIFRNKLLAYSKLAARTLQTKTTRSLGTGPLITDRALDMLVISKPSTIAELLQIPGTITLLEACNEAGMDLMKNVIKFTPARRIG